MVMVLGRERLPFRTLEGDWTPDQRVDKGVYIARSADEWTRLSRRLAPHERSQPPVPALDWSTEMWVFVAVGTRGSGGYQVLIEAISVVQGRIRVHAWEIRPGPGCVTTRNVTYPSLAVAAAAQPGEAEVQTRIAYEDHRETE